MAGLVSPAIDEYTKNIERIGVLTLEISEVNSIYLQDLDLVLGPFEKPAR